MHNRNVKLVIAYDGRCYHGWQRQKKHTTVQGVLEDKISMMAGHPVTLLGSGRTDAGVHAIGQVANFKTSSSISPEAFKKGLNSLLPDDIRIQNAEDVPDDFHSRYDAKSKVYKYQILLSKETDLFRRHYVWHIPWPLNLEKMKTSLSFLVGTHDFSSFRSAGSSNTNPVRDMKLAELSESGNEGIVRLVFEANGFLRHMVRNIVGTVVDVGSGKISVDKFKDICKSGDRRMSGIKAPAQGLFLVKVRY
jgi:tRNA pseudouridine38-40 synthase